MQIPSINHSNEYSMRLTVEGIKLRGSWGATHGRESTFSIFYRIRLPAVRTCAPITRQSRKPYSQSRLSPTRLFVRSFAPSTPVRNVHARRTPAAHLAARINNSRLEGNLWPARRRPRVRARESVRSFIRENLVLFPRFCLISRGDEANMKQLLHLIRK